MSTKTLLHCPPPSPHSWGQLSRAAPFCWVNIRHTLRSFKKRTCRFLGLSQDRRSQQRKQEISWFLGTGETGRTSDLDLQRVGHCQGAPDGMAPQATWPRLMRVAILWKCSGFHKHQAAGHKGQNLPTDVRVQLHPSLLPDDRLTALRTMQEVLPRLGAQPGWEASLQSKHRDLSWSQAVTAHGVVPKTNMTHGLRTA